MEKLQADHSSEKFEGNLDGNVGSEWRIWDMHVHPVDVSGDYTAFIDKLTSSEASVIGINDYCSLKGYEAITKTGGVRGKVIFPVVEFRMHNIVANKKNSDPIKGGVRINFHIIFDNDPKILGAVLNWLNSVDCYEDGKPKQLGVVRDLMKVTLDFEKVTDELKKLFPGQHLVWLPYDEYGGIDEIDPNDNNFKLGLTSKADVFGSSTKKQIDFFKWQDSKYTKKQYSEWFDKPKPCIKGSDSHEIDYPFGRLRNEKSEPIDKFCWIKADTTFKGLKQILSEPDRVFIGQEPDLLKRVRTSPTKFIRNLTIKKILPTSANEIWFENLSIDFNSSLVAIIGNKGSGKSAITDIISLCGNTRQQSSNFSFLIPQKFRRPKPYYLADKFEATLSWHDGNSFVKKLSDNPDDTAPERIKYIPQNFLERLCANVESTDFEAELKKIIYSHTPSEKRLGKSSLDELIQYKSALINDEIEKFQIAISAINATIVNLEEKATESYKSVMSNQLQLKNEELAAHIKIKPEEPPKTEETEATKLLVEQLTIVRNKIQVIETEISDLRTKLSSLSIKSDNLKRAQRFYKNLGSELKNYQSADAEYAKILAESSIEPASVFTFKVDIEPISKVVNIVDEEIAKIVLLLNAENEAGKVFALEKLKESLKKGQEDLDRPARLHQQYLDELKLWQEKKKIIEGASDIEESLKYYEDQLNYLTKLLKPELAKRRSERDAIVKNLIVKKFELLQIRKDLFEPVMGFIDNFEELKARYNVKFDAALELKTFADDFLAFINQARLGSFAGKEEGYKRINDILERTNVTTVEGFFEFVTEVMKNLLFDQRGREKTPVEIIPQLKNGRTVAGVYDFIYHVDYLQPVYNLKLGAKSLQELSPGERGALLLIFYLVLDKDDIPLIIDQPEENLDNETVYHILVHFIKRVKEQRQIVIVTHNPNLAVVCDADQVIHMHIDKDNKNTVRFHSGGIEELNTNQKIINILEGTLPAFNNRDSKYIR